MKSVLVLAGILAVCAPVGVAQETPRARGSLRLLTPATPAPTEAPTTVASNDTPTAPVAAAVPEAAPPEAAPVAAPDPPAVEPAPAVAAATAPAAPAATGWIGPINFSPVAVVDLISRVCMPAVAGDGGDLAAHAVTMGLGGPQPAPEGLARALPPGAVTWQAPAVDGVVYLIGYGEDHMNCGAAVVRPMPEEGFNRVVELLKAPELGFAPESSQMLKGDVRWERMKSPKGQFVDVMEYPILGDAPGVLRADFLPG